MTNHDSTPSQFALVFARDLGLTITDMDQFLSVVEASRLDSSESVCDTIRSTLEGVAEGEIESPGVVA